MHDLISSQGEGVTTHHNMSMLNFENYIFFLFVFTNVS